MTRSRCRPRSATLLLVAVALVADACGEPSVPTASDQASSSQSIAPVSSAGPFEPMTYPPNGAAPCGEAQPTEATHAAYAGSIRRISALDGRTVEFELCAPDVAFPTKLALAAFGINDTAWLQSHIDPGAVGDEAILREVNGTGPYRLEAWNRGSDVSLARNDSYWGETARNERLIVLWREDPNSRMADLQAANVDGIDDVGPGGFETIERDVTLQAVPRLGLNVFYVGFNSAYAPFDNAKVRQAIAQGIDRDRIVKSFYPPGSEVASHFSPCAIAHGCDGKPWYEYDPSAARQLLADAGYPDGFQKTKIQYRDVVRPYLPDPTGVAAELQAQLRVNLGIQAELEVLPDESFLTTVDEGRAEGIHLLGRTASIPEVSSMLDPHFGTAASREFGQPVKAIVDALAVGAATIEDEARTVAYTEANTALRTIVPMVPIAHAGSLTAYRADVLAAQSSPLRYERFAALTPGDRRQFVWLTSAEPGSLYCADETTTAAQTVCAQLNEGLYAFEPGSATVAPALAEGCEPNPELSTWTCTLRTGVTFHDGAGLDANDVVLSFAAQWDAEHPLHRGREGRFQPFIDAFGGLLNAPS